ncbi:MAG: hypothetical protein ABIK99_04140 [candidate division WOR-3 bacterium]
METVIWVIDEKGLPEGIIELLRKEKMRVILIALLGKENDYNLWRHLFSLSEKLTQEGFSVSVGTERGTPFSLLSLMETISPQLLLLPKEKFLLLGPMENDDFLNQLPCPLLLY